MSSQYLTRSGRNILLGLLTLGLAASVGCGHKKSEQNSRVNIKNIPEFISQSELAKSFNGKVSAQAIPGGFRLEHIVVNVRGPGMPRQVFNWDSKCGYDSTTGTDLECPPPPHIELIVPAGEARLIQYLGIYFSETTTGEEYMVFAYGDRVENLVPGDNFVHIDAGTFGDPTNPVAEREIIGQYVTGASGSAGTGPTGTVEIGFKPPTATSPAMEIMSTEMFNGWFNAFTIDGIPFKYTLKETGLVLAGLDYNAVNDRITNGDSDIFHIALPDLFYEQHCSGCSADEEHGGEFVMGFFGPQRSAISPYACYPPEGDITNLWNESSMATNVYFYHTADPNNANANLKGGGLVYSDSLCIGGVEYGNKIELALNDLNDGIHSAGGFRGPFKASSLSFTDTNCDRTDVAAGCYDSSTGSAELKWDYLPNVFGANGISGVAVFTREEPDPCSTGSCGGHDDQDYRDHNSDGYRCHDLIQLGFSHQGDTTGSTQKSMTLNVNIGSGNKLTTLLCPYKIAPDGHRHYFTSGVEIHDIGDWGGQGGNLWVNGPSTFPYATCQSMTLQLGYMTAAAASFNVSTDNPTDIQIYSDPSCTTPTSNLGVAAAMDYTDFWVKIINPAGSGNIDITETTSEGYGSSSFYITEGSQGTMSITGNTTVVVNNCEPYNINFSPITAMAGSVTLTHDVGANGDFYMDPSCTPGNETASIGYAVSESMVTVYFKATTSGTFNLNFSDTNSDYSPSNLSVNINP